MVLSDFSFSLHDYAFLIIEISFFLSCFCVDQGRLAEKIDMRKRRRFYRGSVNHIYQRTTSGNNLFYGYEDFLTFFTIMSVAVRSAGIQVLAVCLMYNHFHMDMLYNNPNFSPSVFYIYYISV